MFLHLQVRPAGGAIMVYPDDIVAIQHTRSAGSFLHCLSNDVSLTSPWRQSYLSLRGVEWGGWWEGGLMALPDGGQWVDGVVCDLRLLYSNTLQRGTETPAASDMRTTSGLIFIHPRVDGQNQIHVQTNVPTLIIVKVSSGETATCSWSAPVSQTGLSVLPSCPEALDQSLAGCRRRSKDEWFSSVTLLLPSVGVQTLNISVSDAVHSESVTVEVCGYEPVTGLSVEPHGHLRVFIGVTQVRK